MNILYLLKYYNVKNNKRFKNNVYLQNYYKI